MATDGVAPDLTAPLTVADVVARRHASGVGVAWVPGDGWYWTPQGRRVAVRMPPHITGRPTAAERRSVFAALKVLGLSYATETSELASANAVHFSCTGPYSMGRLSSNTRSKVRRGLKRFEVGPTSPAVVREHGYVAAADSTVRVGRTAETEERYRRWIERLDQHGYRFWAARHTNGSLAAWAAVMVTDQWAIIPIERSANQFRSDYANNALVYTILADLSGTEERAVSYGWSSLQRGSKIDSLHQFKTSMGFDAHPVRRVVEFAPLVESILRRRVVVRGLDLLAQKRPGSYRVGKAAGLVGATLEDW